MLAPTDFAHVAPGDEYSHDETTPVDAPIAIAPGDETTHDDETTSVDALIAFSRLLDTVSVEGRETTMRVDVMRQTGLLLLDYRRTLEMVGAQLMMLPLHEREVALTAYQRVCQQVAQVMGMFEAALRASS